MEKDILVTVVVPIYNVEKYLDRCIESILNQSYKNIEILLINDGSTDGCLEICNKKASIDNRIRIISQKNQGLSAARNTGIKNAKGKYICFIDSDDYVHKDFVRLLLQSIIENSSDISVCDFSYVNEKNKIWSTREKENQIFSNIDAIKDILIGKQLTEVVAWNKMYKLTLFKENNIYFPKGKLHEDKFTTHKLYYYANKISLISNKLYFYLQRSDSIMGSKFNIKRLDAIEAVSETRKFFEESNIDIKDELDAYEAKMKVYILDNIIRNKFYGKEREQLIKEIKDKKKIYLTNKYINIRFKLAILTLSGKGSIYEILLLIYDRLIKRK